MSGSTLEYMRNNWGDRDAEYSFDTIVKLAEWHVKWKHPRMIAMVPMGLAWSFRAEDGAKIHFGHYEVQTLVPLNVLFGRELELISRNDRGAWVWSEKHVHQLAYYPTTLYSDTVGSAIKKMARAMVALKVTKIVVKGTEPEARLLYRLMTMLGGQQVPQIEAWPSLMVEPMSYLRPEVQKLATRGLLVAVMNLCQEHWDAHRGRPLSKRDKQIWKQEKHRPRARMDHCSLMEVLYYALCGILGGTR